MDDLGNLRIDQNAALVIFTFLQADCGDSEYGEELRSLGQEINPNRDINCRGFGEDSSEDGYLESDIQPSVGLPGNHAEVLVQIAQELREIAAQLEHSVVAQATQNLSRNINASHSTQEWGNYLSTEVERVLRQGLSLNDLPQEHVILALSLTLVKGVCKQAPHLLKNLFNTALQYIRLLSSRL
ncbi:BH3 interacting domain death agonist isoform X2 [Acanthopagrus latus]|uniref:BH3 interacting domain death agonist isoform X2 n=1 Tax=Acanthopagrus latus TaxID=8177 RepID=UPI00187C62D2|nr:BH3 interacting domain death agonist isoform X2 [Acanthopagrus latus]